MSRPEEIAPPEVFYDETEANKYLHSSRMIQVQGQMAERALEMLCLPEGEPALLLDIGCGTGLSGEAIEELEAGHQWVGCDISRDMLGVALRREVEGDLLHRDMGLGLPFRQGCFDGAISISAIQWLCYSDRQEHVPRKRLHIFFQSLYKCLRRGARAVLQFYPQSAEQLQLITASAMRAGFGGGLVIDYPNSTKAKKYFLVLLAGTPESGFVMPNGEGEGGAMSVAGATSVGGGGRPGSESGVRNEGRRPHAKRKKTSREKARGAKAIFKSREWVLAKKEAQRKAGDHVRHDSKYTGRKRSKVRF